MMMNETPRVRESQLIGYALVAVVAHLLLGLVGTLVFNMVVPRYSWSYIFHVLTSPQLYVAVALYGLVAWVGLVVLMQGVRWFFRRWWTQVVVMMLVTCFWRPALSLLAWALVGTPFVWQQLVLFPLVLGWSPAILLWLIYRRERQMAQQLGAGQEN